jgi:hypothetical protein
MFEDERVDPYDGMVKAIDPKLEYHLEDELYKLIEEVNDQ